MISSWKRFAYRDIEHPLADMVIRSHRSFDLEGYLPVGDDSKSFLGPEFTLRQLWQSIDGWHVFVSDLDKQYAVHRDLGPRRRLLHGLDDDGILLAEVPGFLDGEGTTYCLTVPAELLEDLDGGPEPMTPEDIAAWEQRKEREFSLYNEFLDVYYRGVAPPDSSDETWAREGVDTTDSQSITGIIVASERAMLWRIKCDGHAISYRDLAGRLMDQSNTPEWDWGLWGNARWLLTQNIHRNQHLGGGLHIDLFNTLLPEGWVVCERYILLAREAFIPVEGPGGVIGVLVWPNSD